AVSATHASAAVRETRKLPADDCNSAAPPTLASGELLSIVTLTAPPAVDPVRVGSAGALLLGLEGLPPHAGTSAPRAASEAARHACTQNTRRSTMSGSFLSSARVKARRGRAATAVPVSDTWFHYETHPYVRPHGSARRAPQATADPAPTFTVFEYSSP